MNGDRSKRISSPRSYLYVPADQQALLAKALERSADSLILDLEDAVAPSNKAVARQLVTEWLAQRPKFAVPVWLRVNSDNFAADIAVIAPQITGVMVPNADPDLLDGVDNVLSEAEREIGAPDGTFLVMPLIETARGLRASFDLARHRRTARLALGRADLAAELGLRVDPEGPEFRTILLDLVIASSAAGISPPVSPTSTDFRDLDALRESTRRMSDLGLRGRTAIHPAQVAVINEVFTPSSTEIARARQLILAFEEAERSGSGVTLDENGRMVDVAVVRSAREVLRRADIEPPAAQ